MIHARLDYMRIQDPENKIPQDEPVFLIRGQDKIGATVVFIYGLLNQLVGGSKEITDSALIQSDTMGRWSKKKLADM